MKIITIAGEARSGKDTTANFLKQLMEKDNKKAIIVHYADYLKFICKEYFNWDGQKDDAGRSLLQYVGTDLCRYNNPDIWVNIIYQLAVALHTEYDYMIIPDTRFINEINMWKHRTLFYSINIKIKRPNFDNGLTAEQKNHQSERDLDDFKFDYTVSAENITELENEVNELWNKLKGRF